MRPAQNENLTCYLNDLGIVNALGTGKADVFNNVCKNHSPGMGTVFSPMIGKGFFVGKVKESLPAISKPLKRFNCRNNQLALAAAQQIKSSVDNAIELYSAERIGVVIGTSTSGVAETEQAFIQQYRVGDYPADYHYKKQEAATVAEFIATYFELKGPAYVISTACSSSGKVFASARGLIQMGLCDAVIVGGADSLCELTLSGFKSLEAVSDVQSQPFTINRRGINIGEGASLFLMSKQPSLISLKGVGESSDAHHISAPEPTGEGAKQAMLAALHDADLNKNDIGYINAHGTGTRLNDAMESHAIFSVFGDEVHTSSTKPLTGHTLGAAGATEAGLCWLLLNELDNENSVQAKQVFNDQIDPELSRINVTSNHYVNENVLYTMSNSFAFGGNNVSVILGKAGYEKS